VFLYDYLFEVEVSNIRLKNSKTFNRKWNACRIFWLPNYRSPNHRNVMKAWAGKASSWKAHSKRRAFNSP